MLYIHILINVSSMFLKFCLFNSFQKIEGSRVTFMSGESAEFDDIILCTGYKIDLPFLSQPIKDKVLDTEKNAIKVSLAFS